ncbi:MAG: hypothetical protein ACHBN1_28385 [Heteroscytonema crispum UTEX LB 1556]
MNRKFLLALLSSPTIFTSMMSILGVVNPAHAAQPVLRLKDGTACIHHPHAGYKTFVCMRTGQTNQMSRSTPASGVNAQQPSDQNIAMLNFSEEESNKAIALFGCDCPYCVNALRTLQGAQPLVY